MPEPTFTATRSGVPPSGLAYALGHVLPYVAAGVALAEFDVTIKENSYFNKRSGTYAGWTIGAGVDYAATDNLIVRAEYRYSDYGSEWFSNRGASIDLKTHDFRAGVAYKF